MRLARPSNSGSRTGGFLPASAALLQLAFLGFAVVGVDYLCLLGSEGIQRPNSLVHVNLPLVLEGNTTEIDRRDDYIVIGRERNGSGEWRIQLADQFVDLSDIGPYARAACEHVCDIPRRKPTAVIYADKDTPMGLVTAVKQELRAENLLKVSYAVTPVSWRGWPGRMCFPE